MAVVATGGYGRGLLAPGSDIDLLSAPIQADAVGRERRRVHALSALGSGLQSRPRDAHRRPVPKFGHADITIRTALLDCRLILGDRSSSPIRRTFPLRSGDRLRAAVHRRQDGRTRRATQRSGESRYKVEPNIKDGKGGLRDLHTLHWLCEIHLRAGRRRPLRKSGIFTPEEVQTFRRCEDFLWRVRCFLHFLTGRAEEVLSFEVQPAMAQSLGYTSRGGMRAVERFMKHYFLIAKDVGDLTTILCGALEMQQLKTTPRYRRLLSPLNWKMRREVRQRTDFRIDNDRLNVADPEVFTRDPVNLIRYFAHAADDGHLPASRRDPAASSIVAADRR